MVLSKLLHSVVLLDGVLFWGISYSSSLLIKGVRYGKYKFRCLDLSIFFYSVHIACQKYALYVYLQYLQYMFITEIYKSVSLYGQISLCALMQAS